MPKPKKKKRLSFKERKEQSLLSALDDVYSAEDPSYEPVADSDNTPDKKTVKKPSKRSPRKQPAKTSKKPVKKTTDDKAKTVVYVDGENTFFQIFDELRRQRVVKYREDLVKFDLLWLIGKTIPDLRNAVLQYYGVKLKEDNSSEELLKRTQKMIDHKRRWIGWLSSQGAQFVDAGELRIRSVINPRTKEDELNFEEKGVDVKLAVDIVDDAASNKVDRVVLLSSDTDLLHAVLVAQKRGVKITYVSHESRTNNTLIGAVDETLTFSNDDIKEAYKRVN